MSGVINMSVQNQPTRTKIVADPRLPLRVKFIAEGVHARDEVVEAYEAGNIVVFDNFASKLDLKFLQTLPIWRDKDKAIKKAKIENITAPLTVKTFRSHYLSRLFQDYATAAKFRDQVNKHTDQMRALSRTLFPDYRFTGKESNTWRLTETFPEQLHVDSYGGANDELARVRMFFNFDDIPRIWATSYPAAELFDRGWDSAMFRERADQHPNEVNALINAKMPWHELPRHQILFAPGTLWLADTQQVSHEIVYGRRGCGYTFLADPTSLRDKGSLFQTRMRDVVVQQHLRAAVRLQPLPLGGDAYPALSFTKDNHAPTD